MPAWRSWRPSVLSNDLARQLDPVAFSCACGIQPDPWQARFLRSPSKRKLLNCSRQSGKSTTAGTLALHGALYDPGSLTLLLSPSERQSGELLRKVKDGLRALRQDGAAAECERENVLELEFANGSRIVALPGKEGTIRAFSGVRRLVIDEASRVSDALYKSVRPMLAVSGGELVIMSTPFGKRGFFWDTWEATLEPGSQAWQAIGRHWERFEVPATECPRITPEFLDEERRTLGEMWFLQEYFCAFCETLDSVFAYEDVMGALNDAITPI